VLPPLPLAEPPVPVVPPDELSMQAPFVQVWLEVQQAVPHIVPGQVPPIQVLFMQNWFVPHALPQLPQLVASEGTQAPQSSVPDGHLHSEL